MSDKRYECDSCGHEAAGYSQKDLLADGWQWHDVGDGNSLVICGECEEKYAKLRAAKTKTAVA